MEYVDIESIKPFHNNPRHNNSAIEAVAMSISRHGMNQPIVINQDNVICVGHTRWLACKALKHNQVPVIKVKMSDAQFKAYNLSDNKTAENSSWNEGLVELLLKEIDDEQPSLLAHTGFNRSEIDEILKNNEVLEPVKPPKEPVNASGGKQTHHKILTLYFDEVTMPKFLEQIETLQDYFELDNVTNTVMKVVDKVHKECCKK